MKKEKKYFYYEVHVVEGLEDGFGVPVKSETELSESDAIQMALDEGDITKDDVVDYVEELTQEEYEESFEE